MWDAGIGVEIAETFASLTVWDPWSRHADKGGGYYVFDPGEAARKARQARPLKACSFDGCGRPRKEGSGNIYCAEHSAARGLPPDLPCRFPGCTAARVHAQAAQFCRVHRCPRLRARSKKEMNGQQRLGGVG